jgi:membrane protein implicated in regulation of membrane protease activity
MLPGTIIVVVGTDALTQGLTKGRVPWELLGVLFVTILALGLIVWYSRRTLKEKRKNQEERETNNIIPFEKKV